MEAEIRPQRARGERGESLIESIIAMTVLFAVVIAAFAALQTVVTVSADQRMSARGETLLRSAAEQLQNPDLPYVPRAGCPGGGAYVIPPLAISEPGYSVSVTSVEFWGGASATPSLTVGASFDVACPASAASDEGLQQILLSVTHPDGSGDSLTVMKRRS